MDLLIFPNQLFKFKYFPKNIKKIYLIEEPIFFGHREKLYNFNKLKLLLHRSSMKYYFDYLNKKYDVMYIDMNDVDYSIFKNKKLVVFQYYDYLLDKKLKKLDIKFLDTPNQVLKDSDFHDYYNNNNNKKLRHDNFYKFIKNKLNILKDIKSQDKYNRKSIPKNHKPIKNPKLSKIDNLYINNNKDYIEKLFPNNYGDLNNFIYPITHKSSEKWLNHFINKKLSLYGDYQDSIHNEDIFIYHSVISPMLNIGLLNPLDIINKIKKKYQSNKNVKINDYEGFIRQIIGWRSYQILIYKFKYNQIIKSNIFNNNNRINKNWYNGTTGIEPVDFAIKSAFKYGYLHHILRLMVMANFMNLCNIHPHDVYKWFMEFSVDSYDWVMICNVYSMGLWADGGEAMRKPYISTGNYIINLSNFEKGDWYDIWSALFYNFIFKNQKIIAKTYYKNNLTYFKKLSNGEKQKIKKIAKSFIKNNIK